MEKFNNLVNKDFSMSFDIFKEINNIKDHMHQIRRLARYQTEIGDVIRYVKFNNPTLSENEYKNFQILLQVYNKVCNDSTRIIDEHLLDILKF